jgi:hypothetical protein
MKFFLLFVITKHQIRVHIRMHIRMKIVMQIWVYVVMLMRPNVYSGMIEIKLKGQGRRHLHRKVQCLVNVIAYQTLNPSLLGGHFWWMIKVIWKPVSATRAVLVLKATTIVYEQRIQILKVAAGVMRRHSRDASCTQVGS